MQQELVGFLEVRGALSQAALGRAPPPGPPLQSSFVILLHKPGKLT